MSKQPPPAPTASAVGHCPYYHLNCRTPWEWKFTQHQRTTRPPLTKMEKMIPWAWYDKPIDPIRNHMTSRLVKSRLSDVLQTDYVIGSPLSHQDPFIQRHGSQLTANESPPFRQPFTSRRGIRLAYSFPGPARGYSFVISV